MSAPLALVFLKYPEGAPGKNQELPSNLPRAHRGEGTELRGKYLPGKGKRKKKRRRAARARRVREPNAANERLCGKAPAQARHKRAQASGEVNEPPRARERRMGIGAGPGPAKASPSERANEDAPKGGRMVLNHDQHGAGRRAF